MTPTEREAIEAAKMTDEDLGRAINNAACVATLKRPTKDRADETFFAELGRRARELLAAPALPPEPPSGFVRARFPIAVGTEEGGGVGWCASGVNGQTDAENTGDVSENWWGGNYRVSFITADVPLPLLPAEITGVVTP